MSQSDITKNLRLRSLARSIAVTATPISVLQGIFFALEGLRTTYNIVAMSLAAGTLLLVWSYLATSDARLLGGVVVIFCAQLVLFGYNFVGSESPFPFSQLQVAISVSYLAILIATGLASARILAAPNAFLLTFSLAVAFVIGEAALDLLPGENAVSTGPEWTGNAQRPHPTLGVYHEPYSVINLYYPDNPRGYFKQKDIRKNKWKLVVRNGNEANLLFPPSQPELVRVAIEKAEAKTVWEIQLNQPGFTVRKNELYVLSFRARSESARTMVVAFSQAHNPWDGLGLYQVVELTSEWRGFKEEFEATADDENARIHFDLGASEVGVELADVTLNRRADGTIVRAGLPEKYLVNYRFNALGCRGRDYSIPRSSDKVRILVLGDSYTLGIGVHEEDTFVYQLELLLNQQAKAPGSETTYEVVNCGVSDYGTREERLFYQLFGSQYEPDIVLLVMVWNDDRSFLDDMEHGYFRLPGKLEKQFRIWGRVQQYRHKRPEPDYSGSLEEIRQLHSEIKRQSASLAIVFFKDLPLSVENEESNYYSDAWMSLINTLTKGLQGYGIPMLDIRDALFENHTYQDLLVHEIVDLHPNEIAHEIAAQEMGDFLLREGMLSPR